MTTAILPAPRRSRRVVYVLLTVACLLITTTAVSAATVRYDLRNDRKLLGGLTVGGIQIGGLDVDRAESILSEQFEAPLDRPLTITAGAHSTQITPRQLGATTDWTGSLSAALTLQQELPLVRRVWSRATGSGVGRDFPVTLRLDNATLEKFVSDFSATADKKATNASVKLVGELGLEVTPHVNGFLVDRLAAVAAIRKSLQEGNADLALPGQETPAEVTADRFNHMLVVKVGQNKLYQYRNLNVVKVYDVATGRSSEPTPKGLRFVVRKRKNPTWYNPAKDTWGANMPRSIPPGPRNPLGERVLDMNGTLARIHATFRGYSIGYNDSQGCVRMRPAEIKQLYEEVEVGTPVLIVQWGRNRHLSSRRAVDPNEPTAEADLGVPPPASEPPPAPVTTG